MPTLAALIVLALSRPGPNVLFDGSKGRPDTAEQGWFFLSLPPKAKVSGPDSSGAVRLDTVSSMGISAGWGMKLRYALERKAGYSATWKLRIVRESHARDDQRAGFSVFVLGRDHRGIELAYWKDRIFVYNDDKTFKPGEFAKLDTGVIHSYRLAVKGEGYSVSVDGRATLSGKLRDYSAFGFPYNQANSIFVGDDTHRGESVSEWRSFELTR